MLDCLRRLGWVENLKARRDDLARIVIVRDIDIGRLPVWVDFNRFDVFQPYDQFFQAQRIASPDLGRQIEFLGAGIGINELQDDWHDKTADVRKFEHVEVGVLCNCFLKRFPLPHGIAFQRFFQLLQIFLKSVAVLVRNGELVVLVVEVCEIRHALHSRRSILRCVVHVRSRFRLIEILLSQIGVFNLRVLRVHFHLRDLIDRYIDVVCRIEPAVPEPVEVDARCFLQRSEEIVRGGPFEHPALSVLAERKIEEFTAEHGFP